MITMVADDLQDYRLKGEREGNLGHLLLTGGTSPGELTSLVRRTRDNAAGAVGRGRPAHDLTPVIDGYAHDVLTRMLPPSRPHASPRAVAVPPGHLSEFRSRLVEHGQGEGSRPSAVPAERVLRRASAAVRPAASTE
ncbi:hypothetical protein [Streptomyces boncukensis]|uniref:Uncharacterized protein n=1 Tax=Streptomyces boncukensis TaxID=2711219 RepID=A0A6G4X5A0_9ACTN|nr:hypothetical protein [Streptomyces boncukensis]NGO72716.1 hypothetical protein [Streptomyces boncukensis]